MRPRAAPLRTRLLAAFAVLALLPSLLAVVVVPLVGERLERGARERLARRVEAAAGQIGRLRARAAAQVEAIARDDLPAWRELPAGDVDLAAELARRRDLQALEIVDEGGRLVSSAHWPAGLALLDRDRVSPGDAALRVERVAEDYGMGERVALMPAVEAAWRGRSVTVRGGFLLDAERLAELGALMQADLALRDRAGSAWVATRGSPVAAWVGPEALGEGQVSLGGASYRWAVRTLDPSYWLVALEDTRETEAAAASLRRAVLAAAAGSLLVALAWATWLSARLARPVSALADGARRVAEGDLDAAVPVSGPRETVDLARAFNDMTAALRDSRARLVQAERVASWREMARRLAHELKNPLFPIQVSIETLRRAHEIGGAGFDALFRESSATLLDALRSLRRVVDDFSQFARLPAPRLSPVRLDEVVQQVLALYRPQADKVTIEVEADPSLGPVAADSDLVARALGNLVKNALEALPAGGRLVLRTRALPGAAAVDVQDDGPGLSDEQRASLFTPYVTTKPGGTGLGLAIAQGIVADHGGRIDVESAPGQGARFTIILPRHAGEGT